MSIKTKIGEFGFKKILGLELEGRWPEEYKKMVITVAPHTSFHDFPIGIFFRTWYDKKIKFLIKSEFFKYPIVKSVVNFMGGIGVDRSKSNNLVDQVTEIYNNSEEMYITVEPEGTRSKVDRFRTGFYYIAKSANVPVFPIIFDFGNKKVILKEPYFVGDDVEFERKKLEDIYRGVIGYHPEKSFE